MQLKQTKSGTMASLKDGEQATNRRNNNYSGQSNSPNTNTSTNSNSNNNNNEDTASNELKIKRESLEARKQVLEQRLSEKSWLLQQIQKQETAIMNGNYENMTINEFFAQLAQQYKNEQQTQALAKDNNNAILRRRQSTTSRESHQQSNNNNNRYSETQSNRSSEYDNYQPAGGVGDMLVIGVAQQAQQQPHVKSALKKRPAQMQYINPARQHQQPMPQHQHVMEHFAGQKHNPYNQQTRTQPDVISLYSANSANVATLRQQHVAPQQQPIIVQCDKYYLSPTHHSYNEGGFIKSSQNIKKYVSPLASPSNISYEMQQLPPLHPQHHQQRQLDVISLAPSYMSMDAECMQQQQQYRWRSQSHIAPMTPPQHVGSSMTCETKSHSSDMLAAPLARYHNKPKPLDEISLASTTTTNTTTTIEKKAKPKQWLESSLDGPAVIRQLDPSNSPTAAKSRAKLSSQSMSVSGRHYSMSAQRNPHNYPNSSGYVAANNSKTLQHSDERYSKLSQSTSYLNAMEQSVGISASYPLEPLDIPALRHLPPKPNQTQQPTPPPRPAPPGQHLLVGQCNDTGSTGLQNAVVTPPLSAASAGLSPEIRIESPKNMTVVQQATFQPYKEVTKPFEMSDFYKYSTKYKHKDGGAPSRAE